MALQVDIHVNGDELARVAVARRQGSETFARYTWEAGMVDGRTTHGSVWHRPEDGAWVLLERICRAVGSAFGSDGTTP